MAVLAVRGVTQLGSAPVPVAAAAAGDRCETGPTNFLRVANASAGVVTVTVVAVRRCDQGELHNLVVAVPAGATREVGPIADRFASNTDGLAAITYAPNATGVTVEAVRV